MEPYHIDIHSDLIKDKTNNNNEDGATLCKASVVAPEASCLSDDLGTIRTETPPFQVKRSAKVFEGPDCYSMLSPVRGMCVLINNINFDDTSMYRQGSEGEGDQLMELFAQLGFQVKCLKNRSAKQMDEDFDCIASDERHRFHDAFVAIILSHGRDNNVILGIDNRPIFLDSILTKFNNENCPFLISKPKMFFVQACRGFKKDLGVFKECASVVDASGFLVSPITQSVRIPTWTDTLVCNSTCDGFASIRNVVTGSWFGDALIKVFCEHAHDTELHRLLSMVNTRLAEREGDIQAKQSLEVLTRGWSKLLYFNPGISHA